MPLSTIDRWRALDPTARRSLLWFLAKQAAICAVLYAIIALLDRSWWRPAITIVVIAVAANSVRWFDRRYDLVARLRRRAKR